MALGALPAYGRYLGDCDQTTLASDKKRTAIHGFRPRCDFRVNLNDVCAASARFCRLYCVIHYPDVLKLCRGSETGSALGVFVDGQNSRKLFLKIFHSTT